MAPLAPVTPTMTEAARSADIQRRSEHDQVQNPDVSVEIERALHLRQVVGADERLLVREECGDDADSGEIQGPEGCDERQRKETCDCRDVHEPRNDQRLADAK